MKKRLFAICCVALACATVGLAAEDAKVFGKPVRVKGTLDRMMAVCLDGDRLYAGGGTDFYVFDVSSPLAPKMLGKVSGLGSVRQIAVEGAAVQVEGDGLVRSDGQGGVVILRIDLLVAAGVQAHVDGRRRRARPGDGVLQRRPFDGELRIHLHVTVGHGEGIHAVGVGFDGRPRGAAREVKSQRVQRVAGFRGDGQGNGLARGGPRRVRHHHAVCGCEDVDIVERRGGELLARDGRYCSRIQRVVSRRGKPHDAGAAGVFEIAGQLHRAVAAAGVDEIARLCPAEGDIAGWDVVIGDEVAAPDARAAIRAGGRDPAAADDDVAGRGFGVVAGADARAPFAGGRDRAAGDGDVAVRGVGSVTAADARATVDAVGIDRAAGDGDVAVRAVKAAADARAVVDAGGVDRAAGDGDRAVRALVAAADACAALAAGGIDRAAVDGDGAARAIVAAADARAVLAAGGIDGTAVDGDRAARASYAADARAVYIAGII